jgi:hypothetical protein
MSKIHLATRWDPHILYFTLTIYLICSGILPELPSPRLA